ncbi:MAG: S49 family peptidase [Pseudomonas stutzeri]|uniref:S49 family peptidase n=1 Tax=Stutzerimonas frequens TaxID=2968969 RepID=UPI0016A42E5D|nr:S49 family peptidase [Stutzerimonas frequens]NIM30412.1 S49 family peptidase [Stutzerimonas stutzeri]MDL0441846.1 S49 family peptidase [Stutzerimonas frequens]NIM53618.1 S49 family peptidase [Stutzerimonas stutzeri]NIM85925.1 S49 family peptidase [Stutzerimonas stutzeri]NIN80521.1 S49 family peptidase [Stutzerimonas stutzeri]
MNYPQIASRVLNTPLLLEPAYARVFFSALGSRLNIAELKDEQGAIDMGQKLRVDARTYNKTRTNSWGEEEVLFQVVDGIALLDVKGTLAHKSGYLKPYSGMTGYDGIINRYAMMLAESDVKGVLMDMHTPGGEVSGCFDTADRLRQMARQAGKPLWAMACDSACSAGMALASAAERRLVTQTAYMGSVGVVMAHASYEDYLEQEGIKVTLIHSGARKVDGNPYEDLPEEVLSRFQADTDALRQQFAELVARNLGMTSEAVLATEAAVFRGQAAIDVGFAHAMVNGHEAVAEFSEYLSTQGRVTTLGVKRMAGNTPAPTAEAAPPAQAGSEAPAAIDTAAAASAERTRVQGILQHAEAQGRGKMAEHLAFNTSMGVEEAGALLAAAPKEQAANLDASTALDKMMAAEEQPNLTAGAGDAKPNLAQAIAGSWAQATGAKV